MLNDQPDIEVIGQVDNPGEAIIAVRLAKPDIVLVEINFPAGCNLELIDEFMKIDPNVLVVVLTNLNSEDLMVKAFFKGASGYLIKNESSFNALLASLRGLDRGELALSRRLATRVLSKFVRDLYNLPADRTRLSLLTLREQQILIWLSKGITNRAISEQLNISENTVRVHVQKILKKLHLQNRREAGMFADQLIESGFLQEEHR
jgi:two-component system NarL family response regulator